MKTSILLVEDEASLQSYLQTELQFEDYDVSLAEDGEQAWQIFQERGSSISLIILDWMLPKLDGLEVLRRIRRRSEIPVIMMTARDYIGDKVSGLDAGADDYITKPFEIEELLARIRVILRHNQQTKMHHERYQVGQMALDTKTRQVFYGQNVIQLTQREYDLLLILMQHAGDVITRDELLNLVWGVDFDGQVNIVDVYIRHLRNKLGVYTEHPLIETVRGVGYQFRED